MKNSWRDIIKVHPAADMFPMMAEAELLELGNDIKTYGLRQPIVFGCEDAERLDWYLIDGRNRLAAMEAVGFKICFGVKKKWPWLTATTQEGENCEDYVGDGDVRVETGCMAYELVASLNVHRRHLTSEKKREVITALLKANPERSNRAIADTVKASDHTVAKVRTELESTAQIAQLDKTIGKDGKARTIRALPVAKPEPTAAARIISAWTGGPPSNQVELWVSRIRDIAQEARRQIKDAKVREELFWLLKSNLENHLDLEFVEEDDDNEDNDAEAAS